MRVPRVRNVEDRNPFDPPIYLQRSPRNKEIDGRSRRRVRGRLTVTQPQRVMWTNIDFV